MSPKRHWYVQLNHGALLVWAADEAEALEIAAREAPDDAAAGRLEAVRLMDVQYVQNDNGIELA